MRRAHSLPQSDGVVFVDSTASCDADNHSITFMLTTCAAGAVPLAMFITPGQTANDYKLAFSLLVKEMGAELFNGHGRPEIFVTDDSEAERLALEEIWPESSKKLCLFHVPQSVWRWLWNSQHNIAKPDRQLLMSDFQQLIRAETPEKVSTLYSSLNVSATWQKYPHWLAYVDTYWQRRELWGMAWRDHTQRGHHTNNYCEVSVRLYKDIVLSRCKAYNLTTLVDFTVTKLEAYYANRLLKFAHSRNATARLVLQSELRRAQYVTSASEITVVADGTFAVPSETDRNTMYVINTSLGVCQCAVGRHGTFCKHQAAVWKYYTQCGPSLPPVTSADRYSVMCKIVF